MEVIDSTEINKLNASLSDAYKEIEISQVSIWKLQEEKVKLEKELVVSKEKVIEEYKIVDRVLTWV